MVVSTSTVNCLESLVSEMTNYVSSGMLNSLHKDIVESCPLTKLNGGLSQLHSADDAATAS